MSEFNRVSVAPREWPLRIVNGITGRFVAYSIALGLLSLALSAVTVTSRAELFLGPQTLVLSGVGLIVTILVFWCARSFAGSSDAAQLDRPILTTRATFAVIIGAILISVGIIYFAFATFPNSADEGGFLFQADTFRHGHLWNTPPADPGLFAQNYIVARNGIWVCQYLPGWPALLALFELVHLPTWLAAPACGAVLLLLLWAALRHECQSRSLVVALLLSYATTDFFLLNAATYFSHCASALTVVGAIVCILQSERDASWRWPVATGACFGAALLCRMDSAALVATAALAGWIEQGCRRRTLLLGILGAVPLLIVFGTYNELVTGNPLLVPTAWAGNVSIGAHGLSGVEERTEHFRILVQTAWRLGELADTASLVIPVLYFAALVMRIRARRLRFYDVVPIANFIVFLIFPDLGGFQMGPRYWFDGFVVMHITIGSVFSQQPIPWRHFAVACCLLLVPISLARLPALVRFESHVMRERSSVFHLAAALPTNQRSIILINDFYSTWNERANRTAPNFAKDFVRNGISLDKPVLFARGDVPDALGRACTLYPHAAIFAFHLDQAHPNGWLAPLACG
jgi:Dolichyl-phosphate-mannose-protein mannosyltransferase